MSTTRKYDIAPERRNAQKQCFAIEDAEVRILEICKNTVLFRYSQSRFVREVNAVISELIRELDSPELKRRVVEPLRRYAAKTLEREMRLFREKAFFYALVIFSISHKREVREAERLNATVIKSDFPKPLIESPGFKKLVDDWDMQIINHPPQLPLSIYHREYTYKVEEVLTELVAADAKEDYDTNVNLRNIAEMTVRYEYQQDMVQGFKEKGTNLVYIIPHSNCSKRCEPWQVGGSSHPSGLYSLDGSKGTTPEGVPYIPLETATNITYTTRAGKTYINGCITGFGCRHKLKAYKPGEEVKPIPDSVIKKCREIEQKQRSYEREIRYQKRLYVQAKGNAPKIAKEAYKKAGELNSEYIKYSKKNDVAYYPDRTKILDDERDFKLRTRNTKRKLSGIDKKD